MTSANLNAASLYSSSNRSSGRSNRAFGLLASTTEEATASNQFIGFICHDPSSTVYLTLHVLHFLLRFLFFLFHCFLLRSIPMSSHLFSQFPPPLPLNPPLAFPAPCFTHVAICFAFSFSSTRILVHAPPTPTPRSPLSPLLPRFFLHRLLLLLRHFNWSWSLPLSSCS